MLEFFNSAHPFQKLQLRLFSEEKFPAIALFSGVLVQDFAFSCASPGILLNNLSYLYLGWRHPSFQFSCGHASCLHPKSWSGEGVQKTWNR